MAQRLTWLYFLTPSFSVSLVLTRLHQPLLLGLACSRVNWGTLACPWVWGKQRANGQGMARLKALSDWGTGLRRVPQPTPWD